MIFICFIIIRKHNSGEFKAGFVDGIFVICFNGEVRLGNNNTEELSLPCLQFSNEDLYLCISFTAYYDVVLQTLK